MEQLEKTTTETQLENEVHAPEAFLLEFRERNAALDARLDKLLESIQQIRSDIMHDAELDLARISEAAKDMMNGRVYQQIDIQAKGELGVIVKTFNQTLVNLQQLDASVKDQSIKVPELAAQLDAITADTEQATQSVMNRLDTLMSTAEKAGRLFSEMKSNIEGYKTGQQQLLDGISGFLDRAKNGGHSAAIAQEILDYVFEYQISPKPEPLDLSTGQTLIQTVSDDAFEILNILQFQDITRQKIEKIVQMLKQFRQSLDRLLTIFKITEDTESPADEIFEKRSVATQDNIFNTGVTANTDTDSIDDIIAQFKAHQ